MSHWPLLLAVTLAFVHLFSGRLRFLEGLPRSRWLSFAGGVSIAYVFLHLLPELAAREGHLRGLAGIEPGAIESPTFLVGLVGLTVFYGLERVFRNVGDSHPHAHDEGREETPHSGVFWVHMISFGLYNLVASYLLGEKPLTDLQHALYGLALAVHFIVVDFGLREQHRETFHDIGRWILAGCVLVGWAASLVVGVPESVITGLMAFLAGGITLNVLKEELPEERQSRLGAFVMGVVAYAALLLATAA